MARASPSMGILRLESKDAGIKDEDGIGGVKVEYGLRLGGVGAISDTSFGVGIFTVWFGSALSQEGISDPQIKTSRGWVGLD